MEEQASTVVTNLMDDRAKTYCLPPDRAVIAAYEEFENNNFDFRAYSDPEEHPVFKEYRRGFACGDWVALKHQKRPPQDMC